MLTVDFQIIRARYSTLDETLRNKFAQNENVTLNTTTDEGDEEEYEPDFEPVENDEQRHNVIDQSSADIQHDQLSLGHFSFPSPLPLNDEQLTESANTLLDRMFDLVRSSESNGEVKLPRKGLNGNTVDGFDGKSWFVLLIRLLTRGTNSAAGTGQMGPKFDAARDSNLHKDLLTTARERLYAYILEDFRNRLNLAINWLNEEWYNDRRTEVTLDHDVYEYERHYTKWTVRLLDGMLPYVDARDKIIIRFFSELPDLNVDILGRARKLASDPDRAALAVNLLLLVGLPLIFYKPEKK